MQRRAIPLLKTRTINDITNDAKEVDAIKGNNEIVMQCHY